MKRAALLTAGVLSLGACAMGPDAGTSADDSAVARADPRLGEEVDSICFGRTINGFSLVEGEEEAVLLEKGVDDQYYVTLIGTCATNQLRFAQRVAIDQSPAGGCVTQGDFLIFTSSVAGDFDDPGTARCAIDDIYEWHPDAGADMDDESSRSG